VNFQRAAEEDATFCERRNIAIAADDGGVLGEDHNDDQKKKKWKSTEERARKTDGSWDVGKYPPQVVTANRWQTVPTSRHRTGAPGAADWTTAACCRHERTTAASARHPHVLLRHYPSVFHPILQAQPLSILTHHDKTAHNAPIKLLYNDEIRWGDGQPATVLARRRMNDGAVDSPLVTRKSMPEPAIVAPCEETWRGTASTAQPRR
jgi:hypothetical protein